MASAPELNRDRLLVPATRSSLLWRHAPEPGSGQATVRDASSQIDLFGLHIANTTVAAASHAMIDAALSKRKTRVVFANAHVVNEAIRQPDYHHAVKTADRIFADGSGMAVAAKLAGTPLIDNVNGTDLFPRLAADAAAASVRIFLLGSRPGVAAAARRTMSRFGLGDALVGDTHGYFNPGSAEEVAAIAAANASGAGIVLVAMGVPLQDEWIARNAHRLDAPVLVGVGGLFDFFAGSVSRAPHAFRVIGCEWMWRLALEPRRMARRYLLGNLTFLTHALREAVRKRIGANHSAQQSTFGVTHKH